MRWRRTCGPVAGNIAPAATVAEVFDGNGLSVLSPPTGHLTAVTAVVENGVDITDQCSGPVSTAAPGPAMD